MREHFKYFLLYASIFLWASTIVETPVEIYTIYLIMLLYFPVFLFRYGIPPTLLKIFLPLLIAGVANVFLENNSWGQFIKIFVGLFASSLFYYYVLAEQKFNIEVAFGRYAKFTYWLSLLGIIQFVSFQVGLSLGYDYGWLLNKWAVHRGGGFGIRINSVMSEPAYIASAFAPALLLSLHNLIKRKKLFLNRIQSIVVVTCYLLAFSSIGLTALFLALALLYSNYGFIKYVVILGPLLFLGVQFTYENVPEFRERFDGTQYLFTTGDFRSRDIHGSSFVLYNHFHVATENWKRNPVLGTGLGSHETAFERYSVTQFAGALKIDLNKADANSLFLRLLSETGLLGVGFVLFIVFKFYVSRRRSANEQYWIISNGLLLIMFTYLLRQGHYFYNGFPFFVWMYYYVWKWNKATVLEELTEDSEAPAQELSPILTTPTS